MSLKWVRQSTHLVMDYKVFRLRRDKNISPETGEAHGFYIFEAADCVAVVPLTVDQQLLTITQFRHARRMVGCELPSGMIGDGEEPHIAARRELHEETGYTSSQMLPLGVIEPSPALFDHQCHVFVAPNVYYEPRKRIETATECIFTVDKQPLSAVRKQVRRGKITDAVTLAALYLFELQVDKFMGEQTTMSSSTERR